MPAPTRAAPILGDTGDEVSVDSLAGAPAVLNFWGSWCGPCRMVAPILEEISNTHADKVTVAKVDIDANPQVAQQYQIMSIPAMVVFKNGQPVKQIVGAKPKAALLAEFADVLA